MKKDIGIYLILNTINNKVYVGQSIDLTARWRKHQKEKKKSYLYNAMRKYGPEAFKFVVVEYCLRSQLDGKEIYWIKAFKAQDSNYGYNNTTGGKNGFSFSERSRKKMSESRLKYLKDPDNLSLLRDQLTSLREDPRVEARRVRNLASSRRTEKARKEVSKATKERWASTRYKTKVSSKIKESWQNPEARKNHLEARVKLKKSRRSRGEKLIWLTDGAKNKRVTCNPDEYIIPIGWRRGQTK
jgi:group I intron endonuclease